jgi:protein involved in polysaccharide export with SLBB domain
MNRSIARFWPRFALALCLLAPGAAAAQQAPSEWDPARMHVTRAELEDLLARYDAVAQSSAYSGGVRQNARESADRLRQRLEVGDFGVGDRIWLVVDGEEEIPDTLVVEPGPAIMLPNIGSISLRGVLRSELHPYLVRELERYIQKPQVRTASTIRLQIQGAVGTPGFHTFPSDMLLSDALMVAGGPSRNTDWDDLELKRGSETLMEGDDVQGALAEGRSLDHLGLRAGDIVVVPEVTNSRVWPLVLRYGIMITSGLFLGFRIF